MKVNQSVAIIDIINNWEKEAAVVIAAVVVVVVVVVVVAAVVVVVTYQVISILSSGNIRAG